MNWIVFSYTVPAKPRSSFRVSLWRRLGRLGAITTTSGVYILPARDECIEALQWLAQETRQAGGEALVMHVDHFAGLTDGELIERFDQARAREYEAIDAQAAVLEASRQSKKKTVTPAAVQEAVAKLRRRYEESARMDYFSSKLAGPLAARLDAIERAVAPHSDPSERVPAATLAEFRRKRWVTRPRPHVDRLACAWLIRRFIDPHAAIRYAVTPKPGEITFDMSGARFGHEGSRCTFETLLAAFSLHDPALSSMAAIVHEIDLREGPFARPESAGIDAALSGWWLANYADAEHEAHGIALFEGLYLTLVHPHGAHTPASTPKRRRKR
jgi:hypothetical protein